MFAPIPNRQAWIINLHWSQPDGIVPIGLPMRAMLNPETQAVWLFDTAGEAQIMAAIHGVELEAVEEVTVVTFPEPAPLRDFVVSEQGPILTGDPCLVDPVLAVARDVAALYELGGVQVCGRPLEEVLARAIRTYAEREAGT